MSTKILNFTPHDVNVVLREGTRTFPRILVPDGKVAEVRLTTFQEFIGMLDKNDGLIGSGQTMEGAAVVSDPILVYGPQVAKGIVGLPAAGDVRRVPTTAIIVSAMVGEYIAAAPDAWPGAVYAPDSSPESVVRDGKGQIIGVKRLVLYKRAVGAKA